MHACAKVGSCKQQFDNVSRLVEMTTHTIGTEQGYKLSTGHGDATILFPNANVGVYSVFTRVGPIYMYENLSECLHYRRIRCLTVYFKKVCI